MEISNPERVVFPDDGITKGDVVGYFRRVGESLLPFLSGRLLTVERYPQGLAAKGFMQKNAPDHYPEDLIGRHEVPRQGGTTVYPVIDSVEAIEFLANLGVITFHVPPSSAVDQDELDWLIWDLDPPEGRVDLVREAARRLRAMLSERGITTLLMTSGSKGYHLRSNLAPPLPWDQAVRIARGLAALAEAANPELMTLAFRKSDRGGRVFVDWLRNAPLSTSVAPWSLRARRGAPVAAPLIWDELDDVAPDQIRLGSEGERMMFDAWSGVGPIDLTGLAERVDDEVADAGIVLEPFDRFRS